MTATAVKFEKGTFEPLPESDYLVRMTRYEEKPTKKGNGVGAFVTFQVVKGDYKNRLIFDYFLVEHENPKAQEIGLERLNNYLKAVGVSGGMDELGDDRTQISDYLELPFIGSTIIEEGSEYTNKEGNVVMGKAKNKIKSFKSR